MSDFADPGGSVGELDKAQSFAESDVSLKNDKAAVGGGNLRLLSSGDVTGVDMGDAGNRYKGTGDYGLYFTPEFDADNVQVQIANLGANASAIGIKDSAENLIQEDSVNLAPGDTYTLSVSVTAGTQYILYLANGDNYVYDHGSTSFAGNALTVDGGYSTQSIVDGRVFGFREVLCKWSNPAPTSGTSYVEWPYPEDVYAWDRAFFERVLDGETADVYVEEYDGSWTEIAGPIKPGDKLPALPSRNVRFRVELSRADTANNPRLENIYRRRVLPGGGA